MAKPDYSKLFADTDKKYGFPVGTMASLKMQESGNDGRFDIDPAAYHYATDAKGKRKSSAFGLYGILDSTAADPGYGVAPLKDRSVEEQTRFAAEYLQARGKQAGSFEAGLAGYGEGTKYAQQVMSRIGKGTPVQLAQVSQNVPEVQNTVPAQSTAVNPIVNAPNIDWNQLQQAMPAKPVQVADLEYGDQMAMAQPQFNMPRAMPAQVVQPDFNRFKGWMGKA